MTDPAQNQDDYCPNCIRFGLPILPLRYAAARNDSAVGNKRAPQLAAPFGEGVSDIALPDDAARYTLRVLRRGYLYVFNEVRGQWSGYEVDDDGRLKEFDLGAAAPPPATADQAARPVCSRHGEPPLARCIIVPDAEHAGRLWLAYTAVAWTPDTLKENRKQAVRQRHMRCIDVGAWVKGKGKVTQPHLDALTRAGELVGEYHVAALPSVKVCYNYKAFSSSLQEFRPLQPEFEQLKTDAQRSGERWGYLPAMVALDDPCGIAAEVGNIAGATLGEFLSNIHNVRPIAISQAINGIRAAIEEDAENHKINRTDMAAYQMTHGRVGMALAEYIFPETREQNQANYERWRDPSAAELKEARDDAWKKYLGKYDEPRRQREETAWKNRLKSFDEETTLPLARAHVKWMEGGKLLDYVDCNCDAKDAQSGQGLIEQLLLCIGDTQQYAPCFALYEKWLSVTVTERENLLLRGFGYNLDTLRELFAQKVPQGGIDPSTLKGLPWDSLIGGYDKALETLSEGGRNAVVRLTASVGGPLAAVAGKAVDKVVGPALVWIGLIARAKVIMVEGVMPRAEAIKELVARMAAINAKVAPTAKETQALRRAIDIEMRKAQIYGMPEGSQGKFRYLLVADPKVVEDFPGMGKDMTPRKFAEKAVLTSDDHMRLTQQRWRQLLPGAAGLGIVTGILQFVALGKLADDLDKSMVHERTENQWRYRAGVAGFAGVLSETFGKWSESAAKSGNRLLVKLENVMGGFLRGVGKVVGLAAGVVMALWDLVRGGQEYSEGNMGVGVLYILSGIGTIGAAVAFTAWGSTTLASALGLSAAAMTGIGIVLVVLVIVIAVLIEIFKDNKIQDWLERCYYGNLDSNYYNKNPALEMEELKLALEG